MNMSKNWLPKWIFYNNFNGFASVCWNVMHTCREPIIISTYILFNEKIRYSLRALSSEESLKGMKESEESRGLCIQDIFLNEVSLLYFKMKNRMKLTEELKFFHMFNLRSFIEIICIMIILSICLSWLLLIQMAS